MHFHARLFAKAVRLASEKRREAPFVSPQFLQDCKFRASGVHGAARSLAQDGNGSWLNAEDGREESSPGLKSSGAAMRGRAIPGKRCST
ncbi:unnamed protein product [Lasius platythorax]|uniref:Uncharacterized protein n=1 Tax=Lasius platythorax TaxID=488582 RepID=A0AAV2NS87_9HYME